MRIYNRQKDIVLDTAEIFLTLKEAQYMRDMLGSLIDNIKLHHVHINDEQHQKEVTIAIYD
jgi:hypothetical protein